MAMMEINDRLRVLELYSGIGGMHWALKESEVPFEVVMAVDINTTANQIYQYNFPEVNLNSFGIEKLSLKKLRSLRPNAILMSPPCQPFSRVGKKGDCDDVRTKSFLHVMQLLRQIDIQPNYILVENVKGFETSRTREILIETLTACEFVYQEYMLTPLQFGIPNARLRYYLIAKLKSCLPPLLQTSEILYTLPNSKLVPHCEGDEQLSKELHISLSGDTTTNPGNNDTSNISLSSKNFNNCESCGKHSIKVSQSHDTHSAPAPEDSIGYQVCEIPTSKGISEKDGFTHLQCSRNSFHGNKDGGLEAESCSIGNGNSHVVTVLPEAVNVIERLPTHHTLKKLVDAGRNMRFCEEEDDLINEESRSLSEYMEEGEEEDFEQFLLLDKDLRQFVVMDIVLPVLKKSTCFTKRYGHYVEGAGSLVQMSTSAEDTHAASCFKSRVVELKNKHEWGDEELSIIRRLKLRYFSPREVANLMCFPKKFEFPDGVSNIQKYRVLGNSLNVHVVARLIRLLTEDVR